MYRFGDGVESESLKMVSLPVKIGGKQRNIYVDVVTNDIPLLISKPTMLEIGMKIDFSSTQIDGKTVKLKCNSSGHYIIPLTELAHEGCIVVSHVESLSTLNLVEKT